MGGVRSALVLVVAIGFAAGEVTQAAPRSSAVRAEFRKANPCPSTGKVAGACPGWEVDHRLALVCGGSDRVDNLQWLSVEEHRAKTRAEVKLCRTNRVRSPDQSASAAQ